MDSEQQDREEEIFLRALELAPGEERAAWLEEACGGDSDLRLSVEELLEAHDEPVSLLGDTEAGVGTSSDSVPFKGNYDPGESVGTVIGNYKLLELIGEGGFGSVYSAEQLRPVKRRVAVKIIKPGMDSRQVIARFEAERQALAMMDHPNIAKIFDAGTSDSGSPYFVMELVEGLPITAFCDRKSLSLTERLELFASVCRAVQHAHQKGVIHRDIKPSNVMVSIQDGVPVPKVIDFGIAKSLSVGLTDLTLFTHAGQLVGTPAYMSPEQSEFGATDIDTRSDIYSLGALLYEILSGAPPFPIEQLLEAGYVEMQRIIHEETPPSPSIRVSTLDEEEKSSIAVHRGATPEKLGRFLRGDLDFVVMKALEKDRARRYETANALALDIVRYLENEPVSAGPPASAFRRFVRRNRNRIRVSSIFIFAVLALAIPLARKTADAAAGRETARLRSLVQGMTPTFAYELSSMGHEAIGLDTPPDDPAYLAMIEKQKRWQELNPSVAEIYTFRKHPDGNALIIDSETDYNRDGKYTDGPESRTEIGEVWAGTSEALDIAYAGEAGFDDIPYADRWGTWVSAYAPMFDSAGEVDAVLGVDFPAESWLSSIRRARLGVIGYVCLLTLLVWIAGISVITALVKPSGRR